MADRLLVEVDATRLLRLCDELGSVVERYAKAVALETAANIDREATARVRRRGGVTARNIVHTDQLPAWLGGGASANRTAAFVYVEAIQRPANLPLWLEFGTVHMRAYPFLFEAARLEEGPHLRRLEEALQRACDEVNP